MVFATIASIKKGAYMSILKLIAVLGAISSLAFASTEEATFETMHTMLSSLTKVGSCNIRPIKTEGSSDSYEISGMAFSANYKQNATKPTSPYTLSVEIPVNLNKLRRQAKMHSIITDYQVISNDSYSTKISYIIEPKGRDSNFQNPIKTEITMIQDVYLTYIKVIRFERIAINSRSGEQKWKIVHRMTCVDGDGK